MPFLLCVIFLKKILNTQEGKAFFFYSLVYGIFIILLLFFRYYLVSGIKTASILKRVVLIFELPLLCYYFYTVLVNRKVKYFFVFAVIFFTIFSFYDYYMSTERQNNFFPLAIECLFFILIIIYYFYEKIQYSLLTPIYLSMNFWVSTGLLLYFSGNFFLFLYSKTAEKNDTFKLQFNLVYDVFTITKNILLCIAVLINNHTVSVLSKKNLSADANDIFDTFSPIK